MKNSANIVNGDNLGFIRAYTPTVDVLNNIKTYH